LRHCGQRPRCGIEKSEIAGEYVARFDARPDSGGDRTEVNPCAETPASATLLAVRGVEKSFDGVRALHGVSLELRAAEVHAIVGENGAGKSTLTKIITGAIQADAGSMEVRGKTVERNDPNISRALGIAAIYQQPALFPHLTVAENIALPLEMGSGRRTVDWRSRYRRAASLVEGLGATIDPRRLAGTLSMADQQIVEIAKAVGANAKILIMDEPTAVLTELEADRVFSLIRRLKADGVGIIYISHRLEEILAIADRITVLRDGESIACRNAAEVDRATLIEMMVGRSIASVYPKRPVPIGDVALEVRGLKNDRLGLRNISFAVRQGEIFGLAGLVGAGRTSLARTLFGLSPADSGVLLSGKQERIDSPREAIRQGIAYLPEDRRQHGVILKMQIAMNISLARLESVSRCGILIKRKEASLAQEYVDRLRIKTSSIFADTGSLSGGNQQKVALARWLAIQPRILILDEPTQGVDIGSKSEIHELIVRLAETGIAVLLISSELEEIIGMCDRVGVFHSGTLAGIVSGAAATQSRIMSLALGHG
jgi:rhamnose transport system ATP-binding protein